VAKQFSRAALYELIWSKPMRDAAIDAGIARKGMPRGSHSDSSSGTLEQGSREQTDICD
jgi:hypothetical protein